MSKAQVALLLFVLIIPAAIWQGAIISQMWLWFAVPLFNLPVLSIPTAVGLRLLVGVFGSYSTNSNGNRDNAEVLASSISTSFVVPLLYLVIGFIVQLFIVR